MDRLQRRRLMKNWTRLACTCTASVLRNLRKQLWASPASGKAVLASSELLEPRQLLAAGPVISEFMANNDRTLADKDGDYSDWIEIQNPTSGAMNLDGFFLTDDPAQLDKWRFPSTTLPAGGYLVVFASGKDLAVAGQQLHTSFSLDDQGEYLALVAPDGSTIVSDYAPTYPKQLLDVSYGFMPGGTINTTLVGPQSAARVFIPTNGNLGTTWTGMQFDDSRWINGSLGIGFEANTGKALPSELESNNTVAEANDASGNFSPSSSTLYQLSLKGAISLSADADFYNIGSLHNGDILTISASGTGSSRGTLANTYVELYRLNAGSLTLVASDDDGGPGGATDSLVHRFTIASNDTYLIKVKSVGGATGTYDLSVCLENSGPAPTTGGSATAETEPNDSSAAATDVSDSWSMTQYVSRTNATAGSSEDFYRFQFKAGDVVTINVDAIGAMDASVYLLDSSGTVIASDDGTATASAPYSNDANIYAFRIPTTGTYYVKMHKNSGGGSPAYSLSLSLSTSSPPPGPAIFTGLINTSVQTQMLNVNATAYVRIPFYVGDPSIIDTLLLRMKYDDGFAAYLNGQLIVSRNAPSTLAYNSTATAARPVDQQTAAESIDLSAFKNLLFPGNNILAIQGLNIAKDNSDFLVLPELQSVGTIDAGMQYFTTPTPGRANVPGSLGYVQDTKFDHDRGFYDAPFMLTISTDTPGAEIRYTTNGATPTASTGTVYTGPIRIDKTTTLRAAAFKPGYITSTADTQTYLFLDDVIRQSSTGQRPSSEWPSGSVNGQIIDYGMDPDIVNNATYKNTIKDDLKSIPTISIVTDLKNLFDVNTGIYTHAYNDGQAWERPASIELINPDGSKGFQSDIGLRIRGGYSRSGSNPKHGFRIFFREEYGQGKLNYPLFGDDAAQSFDCFDLRAFANYSWSFGGDSRGIFIRDSFSRETQLDMGAPGTRGNFYHVYIDGQYWGLYNSEERPEASYAASYFGGEKEDYDVIKVNANAYNVFATDGNMDAWNRLWAACYAGLSTNAAYYKIQGRNPDGTLNPAYEDLLDVDNLIDYMLTIFYTGNFDAPYSAYVQGPNNFYAIYNRKAKDGFKFVAHDSEHTLLVGGTDFGDGLTMNRTGPYPITSDPTRTTPQGIFQQLMANKEFQLRVADRIQKYFFNGGALTPQATAARFTELKNEIDRAVVGESARWGDSKTHPALTRATWLTQINALLTQYFPRRSDIVFNQLKAKKLYPTIAAPSFNQFGGIISSGFKLDITGAAGTTTYYTLDGSDPRLLGGAVSPKALTYASGIPLNQTVTVKARTLSGTTWSALTEASFTFDMSALRITELMYNPAPPPAGSPFVKDDFEFVELTNTGSSDLDLAGVKFTNGIDFTFPALTLAAGERAILVKNKDAFQSRYGTQIPIAGIYTGSLSNGGETIRLEGALGQLIEEFTYNNSWYPHTDAGGYSLVPNDPRASAILSDKAGWRPSDRLSGNPGQADTGLAPNSIIINELLAHTDHPSGDWIELYNTTDQPIDLSGWFLSDSSQDLSKYQIPAGTVISAHGYVVFNQLDHFGHSGLPTAFAFSELGEAAYLSSSYQGQLGGYRDSVDFAASDREVPFGHYTKSTGGSDFVAMSRPTPGEANASPLVGPVVINEIMYSPPLDASEFIELRNITSAAVLLYDPLRPANTWKFTAGITFTFPAGATIPADGFALVVPTDPEGFRAAYGIPSSVPIFGPYTGALDNAGEKLELSKPGDPESELNGFVPYYQVDRVNYQSDAPWPTAPNGTGPSLARIVADHYGNDVANWAAEVRGGSPGRANNDTIPPTTTIAAVQPDPRQTPIDSITLTFSEPITGFDLADLTLTRSGGSNLLTSAQTLTTSDGLTWTLGNLAALTFIEGNYTLKLNGPTSGIRDLANVPMATSPTEDFTVTTTSLQGTSGDDTFYLVRSGKVVQIFVNKTPDQSPTYSILASALNNLTIDGGPGHDTVTIDLSAGNALPGNRLVLGAEELVLIGDTSSIGTLLPSPAVSASGTLSMGVQNIAFSGLDSLRIDRFAAVTLTTPNGQDTLEIASPSADVTRVSGTSGIIGLVPMTLSNTAKLTLDAAANDADGAASDAFHISAALATKLEIQAGSGANALTLSDGQYTLGDTLTIAGSNLAFSVSGSASLDIPDTLTLAALTISESGQVNLGNSTNNTLAATDLSITGQGRLDLGQGNLIVHATPTSRLAILDQVNNWIKAARSSQPNRWEGPGITSSQAQANSLRGLAVVLNDKGDGQTPLFSQFGTLPADANSILVRCSWNGDANLDGVIDAADYFLADSGFITQKGSYRNGDFNFDGAVDAGDYFLIDSAFIGQAGSPAVPTLAADLPRAPWPFRVSNPTTLGITSPVTVNMDKTHSLPKPLLSVFWNANEGVLDTPIRVNPMC